MGGHKLVQILQSAVADPGKRPGGPAPPLIFRTNWGRIGRKKFWETAPPTPPPPLPLYRKVWIRQCSVKLYTSCLPFLVEYCLYNKLRNVRISLPEDLFLAYVFLVLFFCSFLILIVLFLLSSLLFSHKAISSRWLINTRKKLIVGPKDCRILLSLFFAAKKSFDRQDKQEIVLNCTTCTFLSLLFGKKFRTRVPGFSNCSMNSLKRLNDWCLYNVPTYKVWINFFFF